MFEEKKYRHEHKYLVSDSEALILKQRLKVLMKTDPHAGPDNTYTVTSLYLDDLYDSCLDDCINGTDPKEKFRIRIYNGSDSKITLECKRKENGKGLKTSAALSRDVTENILRGGVVAPDSTQVPLFNRLACLQRTLGLKPRTIVEYRRTPYIYGPGNVRVTFDSGLAASCDTEKFLAGGYTRRPVMPPGKLLMEVKFDGFLPDFLYDALQLGNLTQTAFSKYYLCRKFNNGRTENERY